MTRSIVSRSLLAACVLAAVSPLQAQAQPARATEASPPRTIKPGKETDNIRAKIQMAIELLQADEVSEESRAQAKKALDAALRALAEGDYTRARVLYGTVKGDDGEPAARLGRLLGLGILLDVTGDDSQAKDYIRRRVALEPAEYGQVAKIVRSYDYEDQAKALDAHEKALAKFEAAREVSMTEALRAIGRATAGQHGAGHEAHAEHEAHAKHEVHEHEVHEQDPQGRRDVERKAQAEAKAETRATKKSESGQKEQELFEVWVKDKERNEQATAEVSKRDYADAQKEYRILLDGKKADLDRKRAKIDGFNFTDKSDRGDYFDVITKAEAKDGDGEIVEALNGIRAELRAIRELMARANGAMNDEEHEVEERGEAKGFTFRSYPGFEKADGKTFTVEVHGEDAGARAEAPARRRIGWTSDKAPQTKANAVAPREAVRVRLKNDGGGEGTWKFVPKVIRRAPEAPEAEGKPRVVRFRTIDPTAPKDGAKNDPFGVRVIEVEAPSEVEVAPEPAKAEKKVNWRYIR